MVNTEMIELWDKAFEEYTASVVAYDKAHYIAGFYTDPYSDDIGRYTDHVERKRMEEALASLNSIEKLSKIDGCLGKHANRAEEREWNAYMKKYIDMLKQQIEEAELVWRSHPL